MDQDAGGIKVDFPLCKIPFVAPKEVTHLTK